MSVSLEHLRQASGETLRLLRKRAGIAQEKLALQAGVERSHMGALERGENIPNIETIFRLLPVLDVSFVEFAREFESALRAIRHTKKAAAKPPPPEPSAG